MDIKEAEIIISKYERARAIRDSYHPITDLAFKEVIHQMKTLFSSDDIDKLYQHHQLVQMLRDEDVEQSRLDELTHAIKQYMESFMGKVVHLKTCSIIAEHYLYKKCTETLHKYSHDVAQLYYSHTGKQIEEMTIPVELVCSQFKKKIAQIRHQQTKLLMRCYMPKHICIDEQFEKLKFGHCMICCQPFISGSGH